MTQNSELARCYSCGTGMGDIMISPGGLCDMCKGFCAGCGKASARGRLCDECKETVKVDPDTFELIRPTRTNVPNCRIFKASRVPCLYCIVRRCENGTPPCIKLDGCPRECLLIGDRCCWHDSGDHHEGGGWIPCTDYISCTKWKTCKRRCGISEDGVPLYWHETNRWGCTSTGSWEYCTEYKGADDE